ncbi:hypothetical protein J2S49_000893 [Arcanobacterium wilhelmae]|uniref:Cadherin domain-containing protein n=1 Tax=Arcanobacterium wilhelmae TaxID=1803177 RepID=A0ABT9NAR4_9ACTO|nr:Ig-like domain-containing protein [Arcanobacterium wilhelmae]MDP9800817.1 hypothetical protein [Arcanobacterium wilhelmae]WFN90193.1 Ig-like domain-containing protein [Arcanobacterium wilhelmae]
MLGKNQLGKKIASLVAGGAVLATWAVAAIWHGGIPAQQVDLADSGVWVTNTRNQMVGHVNYPSMALDAQLRTPSGTFDVAQQGDQVLFQDLAANSVAAVDPASATFKASSGLGEAPVSMLGGGQVAAYNPTSGTVWKAPFGAQASLGSEATVAATALPKGDVVITADGELHGASPITRKWVAGEKTYQLPSEVRYNHDLQVSAVGEHSVVLDKTTGSVYLDGGKREVRIGGSKLTLQQPGPDSDTVLVASDSALLKVEVATGTVLATSASADDTPAKPGVPTRPVFHGGCAYGAWGATGVYVRDCPGADDDQAKAAESLRDSQAAVFRTNREAIVLNDTTTGRVWLPDENMQIVDDWDTTETDKDNSESSQKRSNSTSNEAVNPKQQEENRAPEAQPDAFGVRAGQVATLPVLLNDSDPDGDVLSVALKKEPSFGRVMPIRGSRAFQVEVPADASGATNFTYEVSDGRGGKAQATVSLTVHPPEQNLPPRQVVNTATRMASGGRASASVLDDWIDPDGDPIYLASAGPAEKLTIMWSREGSVDLADDGHAPGTVSIPLGVSDGTLTGTGSLALEMLSGDNAPTANADAVQVAVGVPATFSPLENDADPNGDTLRVVSLGALPDGLVANLDPARGTLRVSAERPGTFYFTYSMTDGKSSATGKVRVDALDPQEAGAPVPEMDLAVLSEDSIVVDPLANDWDPTAGVLTLTGVNAPDGVRVQMMGQQFVRVSSDKPLTGPVRVEYTVSNGRQSAKGMIVVVPGDPRADEPPIALPDSLTVRAGDVGAVNVVANDISRLPLEVTAVEGLPADAGELFSGEHDVRVRAVKAGQYELSYTAADERGRRAKAKVALTVLDANDNAAPTPVDLVARTRAGSQVAIRVPLSGIDSDGDSVQLSRIVSNPTKGRATVNADGTITYAANGNAFGTDTFRYEVTDRRGKSATANVRVGVAPASDENQAPVAGADVVSVRPGARVEAPVLVNDVDPDLDPIALVNGGANSGKAGFTVKEIAGGRLAFTAPKEEGSYPVRYEIADARGGRATGVLTVNVSANAPKLAPRPQDDFPQITGTPTEITVEVLENDLDPDGAASQLTVASKDEGTRVDGSSLVITLQAQPRPVVYTVTDVDGLTGSAVVWVPGLVAEKPQVNEEATPRLVDGAVIVLRAGQSIDSNVNVYIDPDVTIDGQVSAGNGITASGTGASLTVRADAGYSGTTQVSVGVVSAAGKRATISIPVRVEAEGETNRPPVVGTATAQVVGGGNPVTLNLTSMANDPDSDNLTYRVEGVPAGVNAQLNGSTLRISAAEGASSGAIRVVVSDGTSTSSGSVNVTVLEQEKPRLGVGTASEQVRRGQSVTVDVNSLVSNPFPTAPTIVAANGGNGVRVSVRGTRLVITPIAVGQFQVKFTLRDATGDSARDVSSVVYVDSVDVPDAPRQVVAQLNGNTATVSFTPGGLGGSSLTSAVITDLNQGDSVECVPGQVCRMPARTPGSHQFQVILYNAIGASAPAVSRPLIIE